MLRIYCEFHRIRLTDLTAAEEAVCLLMGRKCFRCPLRVPKEDGRDLPDDTLPFCNWNIWNNH